MYSGVKNFADLVLARMKKPDALFFRGDDGRDLSYASYWELTGRIANFLVAQQVKRGDRVMLQAEKSVEALAVFLACARLGAIFIPLNPAYTAS
jgi:malonyl-CoA/methylmalonyl-CoA synthetase